MARSMIACSALAHLEWNVARNLELGPQDFQRKLGEAQEPAATPLMGARIRDLARTARVGSVTRP